MRLKKNTRFIILVVGIFALGVAIGTMIPQILSYFVGAGGAITVLALIRDVLKDVLASEKRPSIDYGDVIDEETRLPGHGGEYKDTRYFLIIKNETKNTTAENCRVLLSLRVYQYNDSMQDGESLA